MSAVAAVIDDLNRQIERLRQQLNVERANAASIRAAEREASAQELDELIALLTIDIANEANRTTQFRYEFARDELEKAQARIRARAALEAEKERGT